MKKYRLPAQKREDLSKSATNALRKQGIVPGICYDKEGAQAVAVFINDLKPVVYTPYTFNITLDFDGEEIQAIISDLQFHPLSDEIIHVDFYKISPNVPIRTRLPVTLHGNPAGVKEGGRLLQKIRKMVVRGKPKDLPDEIRVDITDMNLGDSIKVEDLQEEGIEMLNSPGNPVCTVSVPRSLKAKGILTPEEVSEQAKEAEAEAGGESAEEKPAAEGDAPEKEGGEESSKESKE